MRRDDVVAIRGGVDAHARSAGDVELADLSRVRRERDRILGVDAELHGVAAQTEVALRHRQRQPGGDANLLFHEIDAGHFLGDRVLDLDARVHLHEVKLAVLEEELDRAGVHVIRRPCRA